MSRFGGPVPPRVAGPKIAQVILLNADCRDRTGNDVKLQVSVPTDYIEPDFNADRSTIPSSRSVMRRPDADSPNQAASNYESPLRGRPSWTMTPVRIAKVARIRALLEDSAYPSDELLSRVADLLAARMK